MAGSPCPKCCCNRSTPWGCFVYGAIGNRTAASWPTRSPKPPARPCPRRTTPPPPPPARPRHSPAKVSTTACALPARRPAARHRLEKSAQTLASGSGDLVVRSYHPQADTCSASIPEATGLHEREAQLSRLTAWVLQAHEKNHRWELRLPSGTHIATDSGPLHMQRCLQALALEPLKQAARARPLSSTAHPVPWPAPAPHSAARLCGTSWPFRPVLLSPAPRMHRPAGRYWVCPSQRQRKCPEICGIGWCAMGRLETTKKTRLPREVAGFGAFMTLHESVIW